MAMRAKPKTYLTGDENDVRMTFVGKNVWIQCEVTDPPSMAGRSIDLFVSAELVTSMLLGLRDAARDQRL